MRPKITTPCTQRLYGQPAVLAEERDPQTTRPLMADVAEPEWLKVPAACRRSSLGRSSLYKLIGEGRIKSIVVKRRGNVSGVRLISTDSLDAYLHGLAS